MLSIPNWRWLTRYLRARDPHRVPEAKGGDKRRQSGDFGRAGKMPAALARQGMLRSLDLTDEDKAAIRYLSFRR